MPTIVEQAEHDFTDKPAPLLIQSLTAACRGLKIKRDAIEKRKAQIKELEVEADTVERTIIAQMNAEEIKSLNLGGKTGSFILAEQKWYRLPVLANADERKAALKWLKLNGAREAVREDINAQTLTSLMREREANGKKISPLIGVSTKTYLSIRK